MPKARVPKVYIFTIIEWEPPFSLTNTHTDISGWKALVRNVQNRQGAGEGLLLCGCHL